MQFLRQATAQAIDARLMSPEFAFRLEQLMELAGLACAQAIHDEHASKPLVICGPGNNGGDGLVAARHLHHFGMTPTVLYPKLASLKPESYYRDLLKQCEGVDVPILEQLPASSYAKYDLIIDAVFGFGFKGEVRQPFDAVLKAMRESGVPIASIDVPSGWEVDRTDNEARSELIQPAMLISLTAPKLCAQNYKGMHYLGGRFVPSELAREFHLQFPYEAGRQFLKL